ncbi:MAG: FAD-dependent oxidoreductase [Spirochaetales bacterium]|nr:FAD-dependent oxidoreductase [Spirochaetales bacterium]
MSRVLGLVPRSANVFELFVGRDGLLYQAGDCALLIHTDGITSRPYSFSSHPDQEQLSFLFRRLENGFTAWLAQRKPGDEVGVGTPFTLFKPQGGPQEVWIATGTGIAPFVSLLRASRPCVPRELWYGVRSPQEAALQEELRLQEGKGLRLWFSRPDTGANPPHQPSGRLTEHLDQLPLEADLEYYLCGNGSMIRQTTEYLKHQGISPSRLHGEAFYG